jgi:hypothetical protein
MLFADFFGCYLGWVLFMALFFICVWPKVLKRADKEALLRKKLLGMATPPWPRFPK